MSEIVVRKPVIGGKRGWPFAAAIRDLAAEGYVEEEYFFSGNRFRFWEVAGAPHGPALHMERIFAKMARDQVTMSTPPGGQPAELSTLGPVPFAPVLDAALVHVNRWVNGGDAPPKQPLIEVGDGPRIKRNADGNALGGVRLPEMEATLTRNLACMVESGAAGLMGITTPLPADVVRSRYPSKEAYLAAFRAASERAVKEGVLLRRDADEALERAKQTSL